MNENNFLWLKRMLNTLYVLLTIILMLVAMLTVIILRSVANQ